MSLEVNRMDDSLISTEMYEVNVCVWESTGRTVFSCLCRTLEEAIIAKEALEHTYPQTLCIESGNSRIYRRVEISITPVFPANVIDFISRS
jgi:hypothetical protein